MNHLLLRHCVGIFSIAFVVLPARAQDTELKSVRVRVEPVTSSQLSVIIENLRDQALLAWRIVLSPGGSTEFNAIGSLPAPNMPGYGPIAPRETRTISLSIPARGEQAESRVAAAIFADGYYEGSPEALDRFFKDIDGRTAELAYWREALSKVPDGSNKEVSDYLHARIAERAAQSPSDPLRIGPNLSGVLQGPRPDWWAARMTEKHRDDVASALRIANIRFTAAPAGAPPSVAVRTGTTASTDYTLYIENLRETAIEAWAIQTVRFPDGRTRSNTTSDACIGDPALSSSGGRVGRIQPREVRAQPILISSRGDQPPPIQLTMVLFEDLSFEGSVADRDSVLKQRERQARETAYWIQVFKEASAMPIADVRAYLQKKRAERSAQNAVAGGGSSAYEANEAIAALERSPQTFPGWLSTHLSALERQLARLSRHLNR